MFGQRSERPDVRSASRTWKSCSANNRRWFVSDSSSSRLCSRMSCWVQVFRTKTLQMFRMNVRLPSILSYRSGRVVSKDLDFRFWTRKKRRSAARRSSISSLRPARNPAMSRRPLLPLCSRALLMAASECPILRRDSIIDASDTAEAGCAAPTSSGSDDDQSTGAPRGDVFGCGSVVAAKGNFCMWSR